MDFEKVKQTVKELVDSAGIEIVKDIIQTIELEGIEYEEALGYLTSLFKKGFVTYTVKTVAGDFVFRTLTKKENSQIIQEFGKDMDFTKAETALNLDKAIQRRLTLSLIKTPDRDFSSAPLHEKEAYLENLAYPVYNFLANEVLKFETKLNKILSNSDFFLRRLNQVK